MTFSFSRFVLVLCLGFGSGVVTAHAEDKAVPSHVASSPIILRKAKPDELRTWIDLPEQRRKEIINEWMALPETTRPAFPIYRTRMMQAPKEEQALPVTPVDELASDKVEEPVSDEPIQPDSVY